LKIAKFKYCEQKVYKYLFYINFLNNSWCLNLNRSKDKQLPNLNIIPPVKAILIHTLCIAKSDKNNTDEYYLRIFHVFRPANLCMTESLTCGSPHHRSSWTMDSSWKRTTTLKRPLRFVLLGLISNFQMEIKVIGFSLITEIGWKIICRLKKMLINMVLIL